MMHTCDHTMITWRKLSISFSHSLRFRFHWPLPPRAGYFPGTAGRSQAILCIFKCISKWIVIPMGLTVLRRRIGNMESPDTTCASECMCDAYRPNVGAESNSESGWVAATCKLMCGNKNKNRNKNKTKIKTKQKPKKEIQSNANICGAQEAENVEGDFNFYLLKFMCTIFHHWTSISNAELSNEEATKQQKHQHPRSRLPNAKDDEATNKTAFLPPHRGSTPCFTSAPVHWKWNVASKLLFCNFFWLTVRCFPIWKSISDSFSIVISHTTASDPNWKDWDILSLCVANGHRITWLDFVRLLSFISV